MELLHSLAVWMRWTRRNQRVSRAACLLALSLSAVLISTSFDQGLPAQDRYGAVNRFANPRDVLDGADSAAADTTTATRLRSSPYFNYRCESPSPQPNPVSPPSAFGASSNFSRPTGSARTVFEPSDGPSFQEDCEDAPQDCRGNCVLYTPFTSMAYAGGTTPSTGYSELFFPILQSQTDLLYGDVRGLFNAQSAYQGSFGGGLRSLMQDSVILGGYGFYDYRQSELHNSFQQAVVGVEVMTWPWEARTNGYIPTTSSGHGGAASGTAFMQNGNFYLSGTQQTALSGVDAEFGWLVAADSTAQKELRAFAGGYYFNAPSGSQDLPGVYGRLEARLYDLAFLGQGSRLELAAIGAYDDVNQFQVTGFLNVRIALGRPTCPGRLSLIERRMLDRPIRRLDMLTTNSSSAPEQATALVNGNSLSSATVIRPGDNIKAIVESSPVNKLLIVEGGATYSVPNGVVLSQGQTIVGGGSQINVVGNNTGHTGVLTVQGSRPTLDRPNAAGPALTAAPNAAIVGLNVTGGDNGIYGYDTDHLMIAGVNISQTASDGLYLNDVDGFVLRDVTISQSGGIGASWWNINNSFIDNLTISQTTGSAMYYNCGTNVHMNGLFVDATGATDDAVRLHTQLHSTFTNFDIRNSSFNALTIASSTNVSFDQIRLTNAAGDGMQAHQSGTFDLAHFTMSNIGGNGLVIDNTALVSVDHSVFNTVNNVISYRNVANYISGSDNFATGYSTLFTGTTNGGGSIQFTQPNATAP